MRAAAAAAIALLAASAGAAFAAPDRIPAGAGEIRLVEMSGQTSEKALVAAFVPTAKDQPMETLLYDLDGDGKPEVLARLKGPGMCSEDGRACRTVAFRKMAAGWTLVFDRPSQRIEARGGGYGGMRDIVVDGRETYGFTPKGYRLDFAASGKVIEMKPAGPAYTSTLAAKFGPGAGKLTGKRRDVTLKVASVQPKDGETLLLARMEGPGACGAVLGCPWRLLRVSNGAYATVSEGFSGERMALLPVSRGGYRDLAVQTPAGFDVYGWSGQRYVVAERRKEGSVR